MVKALLVVDMLKAFCEKRTKDGPCALFVKGAKELVPNIQREARNLKRGDKVVLVCDFHSPADEEFKRWPKHAVVGTDEVNMVAGLWGEGRNILAAPPPISKGVLLQICRKTRFSGFFRTDLDELLEGVDEVVVTGVVTEFCVFATALDAAYRDLKVVIPKDCVCSLDPDAGERALKWLTDSLGVEVI